MGIRDTETWDGIQLRTLSNFWGLTGTWPSPFQGFKLLGKNLEPLNFTVIDRQHTVNMIEDVSNQ